MIEVESSIFPRFGEISDTVSQLQEDLAMQRDYCASVLREFGADSLQQVIARKTTPDVRMKENVIQPAGTSASTEAVESLSRRVQGMEACNHASMIKID